MTTNGQLPHIFPPRDNTDKDHKQQWYLGFLWFIPEHCAVSEDAETVTLTMFMGGDPTLLLLVKIDHLHINTVGQLAQHKAYAQPHIDNNTCDVATMCKPLHDLPT